MKRVHRFIGIFVVTVIILIVYYSAVHESLTVKDQEELRRWHCVNDRHNGMKTILYWNTMYAEKHRHFMFGSGDVFENCSVPNCFATTDRKLFNTLEDYDAILFHGIEMNLSDLPTTRSSRQRYIYFSWESPLSRPLNSFEFASWPNYYNWTMSYRLDSDIVRSYGLIRDIATNEIVFPPRGENDVIHWRFPNETTYHPSDEELSLIKNKTTAATWFVSHCKTLSFRERLVEKIKNYLKVDIYGSCGELRCNKKEEDCYGLIEKKYFYYLSFENTLCKDYITEKLFLPMQKYVIPIVYGLVNYRNYLPPHSYINVNDFESAEELTNYMINLANDPYRYASYFWWKKYYRIEDSTKFTLCNLCEKLHDCSLPKKSLEDFLKYYVTGQCHTTTQLFP